MSIPQNFKGFGGDNSLFVVLIERTASEFETVYRKAEKLFQQLEEVKEQFQYWVVLGCIDNEKLAEDNLRDMADWERNFKMIKLKGKEAEKLPL